VYPVRVDPYRLAEERSRALHAAVAARIQADSGILDRARAVVADWLAHGTVAPAYAEAWRTLLQRPTPTILTALTEPSQEMHDLRQVSPFAGVLDPRTRWRIRDEVRARLADEAR
jgi:hypothetical protein